jgi:sugar phosphate isomerase/epimerase
MSTGGKREDADTYYEAARRVARHATDVGATFVLKTHGRLSSTAADCRKALDEIGSEGFGIWYDPGNVLYYDNVRPETDVLDIAGDTIGICVKDCRRVGDERDVMITPGTGDAKLEEVFARLTAAGFDGPAVVECVAGETMEELTEEARKTREFLLRTLCSQGPAR